LIGRADLLVSRGLRAKLPEAARQRRPTKNSVKMRRAAVLIQIIRPVCIFKKKQPPETGDSFGLRWQSAAATALLWETPSGVPPKAFWLVAAVPDFPFPDPILKTRPANKKAGPKPRV